MLTLQEAADLSDTAPRLLKYAVEHGIVPGANAGGCGYLVEPSQNFREETRMRLAAWLDGGRR